MFILLFFLLFLQIKSEYVTLKISPSSVVGQTRAGASTICQSVCTGSDDSFALLSFTGDPLSSWSKFSTSKDLYCGDLIGTTNQLLFGTLDKSLVEGDPSLSNIFTFATGGISPVDVCIDGGNDWQLSGSVYVPGNPTLKTNILQVGTLQCSFLSSTSFNPFFCACYFSGTVSPTLFPTRKPTTHTPTLSPTKNPTIKPTTSKPTQNPTFFNSQVKMVKLPKGTQVTVKNSISYEGVPTKTFIQAGSYEEVTYKNVEWVLNGVAQSTIPTCLPHPNPLPGTLLDNKCPCLEKCISLPPYLQASILKYTTLRCCLTSWEETLLPVSTPLPPDVWVFNATTSFPPPPITFGTIRCENPIERKLNCDFFRQSPSTYVLQCAQEPIQCYQNDTLGYAFGLFWDRNPNFPYTGVLEEPQLRGVASILNFKHYSRDGKEEDPLNPELMNSYYWLNSSTQTLPWEFQLIVMPDIIQLRPQNWFLTLFSDQNLDPTLCLLTFSPSQCEFLTWKNLTDVWWKLPGVWLIPQTNLTIYPISWGVEGGTFDGVEVWKGGEQIYQNLTPSSSYLIPINIVLPMQIRLLGGSIWDIPSSQASPDVPFYPDSLWSSLQMGYLQFPFTQLVTTQSRGGAIEGDWPYQNSTPSLNITLNLQFGLTPNLWSSLSEKIIEENIYPFNLPLFLDEPLYTVRPINYTLDRDYLIRIWSTHLARRHPSEDNDCKTFQLGGLVFYEDEGYTQPFFQTPLQEIPPNGRAGGCRCEKGGILTLRDDQTQCGECFIGMGGNKCDVPFGSDPIPGSPPGVCSNHGVVKRENMTIVEELKLFNGKFSLCSQLVFNNEIYVLQKDAAQGAAYLFTSGSSEIVLLRGQFFFNLIPLPTQLTQTLPSRWETPMGVIQCLGPYNSFILMNPPLIISPIKGTFKKYLQV